MTGRSLEVLEAGAPRPGLVGVPLTRRKRPGERVVLIVLFACGFLSVATTVGIIGTLVFETLAFLAEVPVLGFLFGTKWSPLIAPESYGVLPLVFGTLLITAIAAMVGAPIGLATAIYLSEYASGRVQRVLKPTLEILAGIPTVVLGYFALNFLTLVVIRRVFPGADVFNALSAGIAVGIMIVPTIASIAEDAMSAVPGALREGAYGLGASKMTVASRVVFPAALSGIMAGVILGLSRAVGETMIVAIAAGSTPTFTMNPLRSVQTMTGYIVQASLGDNPQTSLEFKGIFAVGALLFCITLALNMLSQRLVRRFRQEY